MRRESGAERGKPEECSVRLWRGYVTAQFHAWREGDDEPVLASRPFRTFRPPWEPRIPPARLPAARTALQELTAELARRGWRRARTVDEHGHVIEPRADELRDVEPAHIAEQLFLRVLEQVAGETGATAAELGRALYGPDAGSIDHLPQRIGSRLRGLQLQGKVARHETSGSSHWYPAGERRPTIAKSADHNGR